MLSSFEGVHGDISVALIFVGEMLINQQKFAPAEPFIREALAISQKLHAFNNGVHADVAVAYKFLGNTLKGQHKFVEVLRFNLNLNYLIQFTE